MPENMPVGTASTSWVDNGGQVHIRVYSTDGYTITERCWDGSGWYEGSLGSIGAQGGQVSATSWYEGGTSYIRVYCNFEDGTIEWCWDGNGWYKGAYTV